MKTHVCSRQILHVKGEAHAIRNFCICTSYNSRRIFWSDNCHNKTTVYKPTLQLHLLRGFCFENFNARSFYTTHLFFEYDIIGHHEFAKTERKFPISESTRTKFWGIGQCVTFRRKLSCGKPACKSARPTRNYSKSKLVGGVVIGDQKDGSLS